MLYEIGAIVIEPSGDDGAESVDEEGGFIVAGRVIGCCFKICSVLIVIAFDDSKEPREVLCSIASIDTCIREHIYNYVLDLGFHIRSSLHKLVGQTDNFGGDFLSLAFHDDVIHRIGKSYEHATNQSDRNTDNHRHISV